MNNLFVIFQRIVLKIKPKDKKELIFLTASSEKYFKNIPYLLSSINLNEPNKKIIFYDLGISESQKNELQKFKNVKLKHFEFETYPLHFKELESFAWKPAIINEVLISYPNICLAYLDTRCRLEKKLTTARKLTRLFGIYTPLSVGTIEDFTHSDTLNFIDKNKKTRGKRMIAAAFILINSNSKFATSTINKWYQISRDKHIISPIGSGRNNHRQDQSILSILLMKNKLYNLIPRNIFGGVTLHNELESI